MLVVKELLNDGYERVVHGVDETTGLDAIIALHSSTLGPAIGGCRFWEYDTFLEHKNDALRLGYGMALKNSLAGLDHGGGKAVINSKGVKDKQAVLRSFAELVDVLDGAYVTAGDVGITQDDLAYLKQHTDNVCGYDVYTAPYTSYGVYKALQAAMKFKKMADIDHTHVAISGLGKVGAGIAKQLDDDCATITAADVYLPAVIELAKDVWFKDVHHSKIYEVKCDVLMPCALGGVITPDSIRKLNTKVICGAANNQLVTPSAGRILHNHNITYVPDYLANAGGVIGVGVAFKGIKDEDEVKRIIDEKIYNRTLEVLERSRETKEAPFIVADQIAKERLGII